LVAPLVVGIVVGGAVLVAVVWWLLLRLARSRDKRNDASDAGNHKLREVHIETTSSLLC
jgi:hypothetical protein